MIIYKENIGGHSGTFVLKKMELTQENIDYIKTAFSKMKSKQDLLLLLNYAKKIVYGEKAIPFQIKHIHFYSNPNANKKRYSQFTVKKKSGGERIIHAPVKGLKAIQKCLSLILQTVYQDHQHKAANGFVWNRSIVDNAKVHIGSLYVYNIDLKDFFPSIDQARVWKCLQLNPFNLINLNIEEDEAELITFVEFQKVNNISESTPVVKGKYKNYIEVSGGKLYSSKNLDLKKPVFVVKEKGEKGNVDSDTWLLVNEIKKTSKYESVNIIAALCCTELEVERMKANGELEKVKRNVLPQGAPTSPVITNIVCHRLDYLLSAAAKRFGLRYSRYADDITFSSMQNVYQKESDFVKELHRIIADQNFRINESKTRLQKEGYRQEVTGLVVNEKANVKQRYIKQIRQWLFYWEKFGYERADSYFQSKYISDRSHIDHTKPNMVNVICGKLDYLKMVKGAENSMYLKLRERLDLLISNEKPISEILVIWEKEGIERAIEKYYRLNLNENLC